MKLSKLLPRNLPFGLFLVAAITLGIVGPAGAPPVGGKPGGGKPFVDKQIDPYRPTTQERETREEFKRFDSDVTGISDRETRPLTYEYLQEQLRVSVNHRTIPIFADMPHLRVRATDVFNHDSDIANIAREILEPMLDRPASLTKTTVALTLPIHDSTTEKLYSEVIPMQARTKGEQFLGLLDALSVKRELDQTQRIELLKKWAGELVVVIGHRNPISGHFEYVNGAESNAIDIRALEEDGAAAKVLILVIGCESARSTAFGSERNLNSLDVVRNVASGLELLARGPETLRSFYKGLATKQMALSMDLFRFKDHRTLDPVDEKRERLGGEVRVPPIAVPRNLSGEPSYPVARDINDEYNPKYVYLAQPCPRLDRIFHSEAGGWIFFGGSALIVTIIWMIRFLEGFLETSGRGNTADYIPMAFFILTLYCYGKWAGAMIFAIIALDYFQDGKYFLALVPAVLAVAISRNLVDDEENSSILTWLQRAYLGLMMTSFIVMWAYYEYCRA